MIEIVSVKSQDNYKVLIEFTTGETKLVDLMPLLYGPIFERIRSDADYFRTVRVDRELGTIGWDNGADIDPDVLYGSFQPAWMEPEVTQR